MVYNIKNCGFLVIFENENSMRASTRERLVQTS